MPVVGPTRQQKLDKTRELLAEDDTLDIPYFEDMCGNFSDKIGESFFMCFLEMLNDHENKMTDTDNYIDQYPAGEYIKYEDKINPSKKAKRSIKSGKKNNKKKMPKKKGQKTSDDVVEINEEKNNDDDSIEIEEEKKTTPKKKALALMKGDGKYFLTAVLTRLTYEWYSIEDFPVSKTVQQSGEYAKANVLDDFNDDILTPVVNTVNKLGYLVSGFGNHGLDRLFRDRVIEPYFSGNQNSGKYLVEYMITYVKLIAKFFMLEFLESRKSVSHKLLKRIICSLHTSGSVEGDDGTLGFVSVNACYHYTEELVKAVAPVKKPKKAPVKKGKKVKKKVDEGGADKEEVEEDVEGADKEGADKEDVDKDVPKKPRTIRRLMRKKK